MSKICIDMWQGGRKIPLSEIIGGIQFAQQPTWVIHHFSGVGKPPGDMEMSAFEACVENSSSGYRFDFDDFLNFVASLYDIYDISLTGEVGGRGKVVQIEGVDSTFWEVWVDDGIARLLSMPH